MLLNDAMDIAMPIWESLKPVCDIRKIAGSIRREKPEPKDIEIVCLPKVVILKDMFGWDEGTIREPLFHKIVSELGRVIKGKTDGKYMQIALPPHWKSEQEFFDWIKLKWVSPKNRNV